VEKLFLRAQSDILEDGHVRIQAHTHKLSYNSHGFSNRIEIDANFILTDFSDTADRKDKRFSFQPGSKWLYKNHGLNEWIEDSSHNEPTFLLLCSAEFQTKISNENIPVSKVYSLTVAGHSLLRFEKLTSEKFDVLARIIQGKQIFEGKIILNGAFLGERRKTVFKEFNYSFEFKGDLLDPKLFGRTFDGSEFGLDSFKEDEEANLKWKLPSGIAEGTEFKVFERKTNTVSHHFFNVKSVDSHEPFRRNYFVKDNNGRFLHDSTDKDLFDLPGNFYDTPGSNVVFYNTFQANHYKEYRPSNSFATLSSKETFNYCGANNPGNLLVKFLNTQPSIDTNEFASLIQQLSKNIDRKTAKRILFYWRHLGYLDFQVYGQDLSVSPPTLFFLKTEGGLKGFLTGSRSDSFVDEVKSKAIENSLRIYTENHSSQELFPFPQMIVLYDPYANIDKFQNFARSLAIKVNNGMIYQLAALYFQNGVESFITNIASNEIYRLDHNRKQLFDINTISWQESNQRIDSIPSPSLVKYDNFNDFKTILYVLRYENVSYSLPEYSLAIFYLLAIHSKKILKQRIDRNYVGRMCSDLLVPLYIPLPFWLERGIILSNARVPKIEYLEGKLYRVYEKIPDTIIELISNKLKQEITLLL
jgi:hypothetical protein